MERRRPGIGTPRILLASRQEGYRSGTVQQCGRWLCVLLLATLAPAVRAQGSIQSSEPANRGQGGFWRVFAAGFASSILAHEGAHLVAAYAVGGRPRFGLDAGRPTVYSGIDAQSEPGRQFIFSSAGLTAQTLLDELLLDVPHGDGAARSGPFERGLLAGGIATTLFYITIGRSGSVSDVDYMARTSSLSKTTISALYGGAAALHLWRIGRDERHAGFFVAPDPRSGLRLGLRFQGH